MVQRGKPAFQLERPEFNERDQASMRETKFHERETITMVQERP